MNTNELRRHLAKLGATFIEGSSHTKVTLNGRKSVIPRHGAKDLKTGTLRAILKQLGLKEGDL
jgi:mRNA interferase HicA